MQTALPSARRHQLRSAALAARAAREARKVEQRGPAAVAAVVATHQAFAATEAQDAITEMLADQGIKASSDALLNVLLFTTSARTFTSLADAAVVDPVVSERFAFDRLVQSLVQDAGRAAEQVAVAVRPNVGWTRQLTPPSCSRCVVLAGRIYRYSDGFMRHPKDDCVTRPIAQGDTRQGLDVAALVRSNQVRGLSKADQEALDLGASLSDVVNVRRKAAGLSQAGSVLSRGGRPTPAGIFKSTAGGSREETLTALAEAGYIT